MAFSLDRVYILGDLSKLNKTPSDGTCLEEPPRGFCDVACSCCFYLNEGFSFIAFRRHSSFLGFSVTILPPVLRFSADVFTHRRFFTLQSIDCDSDAGRNTPSRILLCTCPHRVIPSGWRMDLNHPYCGYKTIDLSIAPVNHEDRVKIRLLNMFCLFKVISKDYKTNLNKT